MSAPVSTRADGAPAALPIECDHTVPPASDRRAALALACVRGVGPVRYRELARRFGGADVALLSAIALPEREAALRAADELMDRAARAAADALLLGDPRYPASLHELVDPPPVLWTAGDAALLHRHRLAVAVVGTRRMSAYGERATHALAGALAGAGALVVSGMALGVDAAAHVAALDAGAPTVAVLGTGVDGAYPRSHRRLHARIREHGLLVSEQPPGERGTPGAFPRRNRIIAALAAATLVVEAGADSGALITAGAALDLGRTVAAVPGPVDAATSVGCNRLLRDGAVVVADADDALALVGLAAARGATDPSTEVAPGSSPTRLVGDEAAVWQALAAPAPDIDTLVSLVGLPARRCVAAVAMLEVAGVVETTFSGALRRRA